jgi:hypothetical protein
MLRNPVKFIATPPVKISNTNKLAVKVNQKYYKEPYYYTGAELYHHTNYSTMEEPSSDHYPPEKLIGPTTFLSTAYGRGFYGVSTTSNSFYTVPWGASELRIGNLQNSHRLLPSLNRVHHQTHKILGWHFRMQIHFGRAIRGTGRQMCTLYPHLQM